MSKCMTPKEEWTEFVLDKTIEKIKREINKAIEKERIGYTISEIGVGLELAIGIIDSVIKDGDTE